MAEKPEEEKLKSKLGRKLSKRSSARSPEPPKVKPAAAKSATLPPNMDPGAMASHQGSGSGLFSKLKRRLRLGSSKKKYDLNTSPNKEKPQRSRRRSDETQLRQSKDSFEDNAEGASKSSKKPSSAKTPRKVKTDKQEVILIRKDKRVSVICKAENGDAEVLFSNIENSDEDSSSAWGGLEEDPYATLNSVRDEIDQKNNGSSKTNSPSKSSASSRDNKAISPAQKSSVSTPSKTPDSAEEYPYARIDPSKKRSRSLQQETPLWAQDFNVQVRARIRSQVEPDYETLEEVQHRKSELMSSPHGACSSSNNNLPTANTSSITDGMNTSQNSLDDLDPDYESLEEIQHKQRALSLHLSPQNLTLAKDGEGTSEPFDPYDSLTRPKSFTTGAGERTDPSPISVSSLARQIQSQENLVPPIRLSRPSSALVSPSSLAPLAAGVDTSLPRDPSLEHQITGEGQEAEEECLYDNPNVILRKQQQQHNSMLLSTSSSGGVQTSPARSLALGDILATPTHHHHHHIKTPAEEELVEKLSSLLAPPLPLRNYQKDEVYQTVSSGKSKVFVRTSTTKSTSSSARHSWSSQNSRHAMTEFLDAASAGSGSSISPRSQHRWTGRPADSDGRRHSTHSARDYTWYGGGEGSPSCKSKARKKESSRESLASDKESCHSQDSEKIFFTCGEVANGCNMATEENHPAISEVINPAACEPEKLNTERISQADLKSDAGGATIDQAYVCHQVLAEELDSMSEPAAEEKLMSPVNVSATDVLKSDHQESETETLDTLNTSEFDMMNGDQATVRTSVTEEKSLNSGVAEEMSNPSDRTENSMKSVDFSTTFASVIKQKPGNHLLGLHINTESFAAETSGMVLSEQSPSNTIDQSVSQHYSVENGAFNIVSSVPQNEPVEDTALLREFSRNFALQVIDRAVKQWFEAEQEQQEKPMNAPGHGIALDHHGETSSARGESNQTSISPERSTKAQNYCWDRPNSEAAIEEKEVQLEAREKQQIVEDTSSSTPGSNSTCTSKSEEDLQKVGTPSEECGILAACAVSPDCSTDGDNNMDRFRSQGARPKVTPLHFSPVSVHSRGLASTETADAEEAIQAWDMKRKAEAERFEQCFLSDDDDVGMWDDTLSPSVPDMDFMNFLGEREEILQLMNLGTGLQDSDARRKIMRARNRPKMDQDLSIQETVYVDSDSDEEFEDESKKACQLPKKDIPEIHKSYVVKVQRDLSITKIVRPLVYANPRLLENVISGKFKFDPSLDKDYISYGVFKKGRYFCYLPPDTKFLVEEKLKAYFYAKRDERATRRYVKKKHLQRLQQRADKLQVKIDKKLDEVKDFPTFHDVRMHLLKTLQMDSWEPERTLVTKFPTSSPTSDATATNQPKESKNSVFPAKTQSTAGKGCSKANGLPKGATAGKDSPCTHTRKPQPCNNFQFENTIFLEEQRDEELSSLDYNPQPCPSPGTSMDTVLDDFLKLCDRSLACKRCGDTDDSDSEDELAALDVYVRTVGPRFNRALHGELAYTTICRRQRECCNPNTAGLPIAAVTASEPCQGGPCHLSWQDWSSMDLHFRKLVPHSSPRLDFQFLLKTYAELKHFVLKGRKRNLECKGCYVKNFLQQTHLNQGNTDTSFFTTSKCSRVEEFVFLKLLRDELCHFGHMTKVSAGARALFVEERDIGHSCLFLLRTILRMIHRMERRVQLVKVRHTGENVQAVQDLSLIEDHRQFHVSNFLRFRADSMLDSLRTWMTPEDYSPDPNILVTGRTVVAHTDSRSTLELAGMLGVADPQPLQEGEDFLESMQQLQTKDWYWGPISYEEAAMILQDKEDGSFLVRDSSDHKYLLSLSFKSLGEIHHTRMEHAKGLFSFWSQPESHGKARICEFIDKSVQNSRDGRFLYFLRPSARGVPPLPIRLLNPVSRSFRVASLRHLSRFVIRQNVRKDHLNQLPVPEKVKRYLREKQYYVEITDDEWPFDGDCTKS